MALQLTAALQKQLVNCATNADCWHTAQLMAASTVDTRCLQLHSSEEMTNHELWQRDKLLQLLPATI
jgi:hypothetical protein